MYCNKCGAKIPDDSIFCGNCGSPVTPSEQSPYVPRSQMKQKTASILDALTKILRAFFSPEPESSLAVAQQSRAHVWTVLIGINVLVFAFAYVVNLRQLIGSALSSLSSAIGMNGLPVEASDFVHFGYFFLFGLLLSILANGIVFGAYYVMEKVIQHGEQDMISMLNTVAVSTTPFTLICLVNMILGMIWGYLVIPFLLIAALAQVLLLYMALQENAETNRASYVVFLGVCLAALFLTFLFCFLFTKAGFKASI